MKQHIYRCAFRLIMSVIGAIALAALLPGCNTVPGEVGGMIAQRLPAMLGPADHYDVHVGGSIFDAVRGKLDSVHIHGDNVALNPAMRVSSFDADASNIHANTRTDAIESIGRTTFNIAMNQSNMDSFMSSAREADFRRGARIALGTDEITYSDSMRFLGLATPFAVSGTLSPHPGRPDQMDFVPSGGSISRLRLPARLISLAVARQNPVVDLSRMKYPVSIRSAQVQRGMLLITGTVALSSLVGTNPAAAPAH